MNILFSTIGKRGYIADFFRPHLENGDRIVGTGMTKWTPGFSSCDTARLVPAIEDPSYLDAVLEVCESERIDAVLSFADPDVHRLSEAHEEFEKRGIRAMIPSKEVADITFDKYRMSLFMQQNGFATPVTARTLEEASSFSYPMYVKPRRGSGSFHTFRVHNERELTAFFGLSDDMIIQEAVIGEEINAEICTDFSGQPVGISTWRKYQSKLGETEQAETFRDPVVIEFALGLGKVLAATGPMDVDLIRTAEGIVVLEANPRFGGGYPVSHLAGADFPRLIVELIRHGRVEPNYSFAPGVVMMKRLEIIGGPAETFFSTHTGSR